MNGYAEVGVEGEQGGAGVGGSGRVTLNSSSCAQRIVKSNQLKCGRLEKRQVYCRAMQGDGWLLT